MAAKVRVRLRVRKRSSTTKSGRLVRAVKSKTSTIGAVVTTTTAKPPTKAAPSQATRLRVITKAIKTTNTTKTTTASATLYLKNGVFGNPCRISTIKKSVALATAAHLPHHLVAPKIVPRPTTTDTTRSRSRPPRQVRLKTGRWTKAEDNALYQGVVEYLAQFGLEPKPLAHLPLHENVKEEEDKEVKDGGTAVNEHGCGGIDEKLRPSTLERIVDDSRRRVEYDAAVWKASAAACQLGERYRSSTNHIFASESDSVRDRENDTSLFDELVDVSRDNFLADSGQDGYLNLESRAGHGHHTPLLLPFHVSSLVGDADADKGTRSTAESGFLNGNIFVRTTTRPPPTIRPQETCIDAYNENTQVSDDYHNYNNLPHQHLQQQQQRTQLQQQYSQHVRHINQVYSDQNHHKQQQYQWSPLPRYQQQNYQQQPHGPGDQQYGVPSIYPHWEEAPYETRAGDIWLAPINEVNSRTLELSMAANRGETSGSGAAFTTEGGYGRARSNTNRSATAATSSAAIETALFGKLFSDTTNTNTLSTSPSPTIITSTSTPTPPPCYKTQASYASAVSRRLTTCPWSHIATLAVPGRTGVQAQARWSEALDPRVKKGPWSEDEDALLLEGVERSDKCWIWIADSIEGRTQRQCRTRWVQLTINAERKAALVALEGVTEF
ncbi:Myb- protein B [Linnemannia hyalina]|uniref:Myb- protein B n=1 Tax=Linnemannia hyalina TaxID=64524 RepID=A0A9P8BXS3_9FUNG|nr:Myb- protein B [Linnemannia hyalina]